MLSDQRHIVNLNLGSYGVLFFWQMEKLSDTQCQPESQLKFITEAWLQVNEWIFGYTFVQSFWNRVIQRIHIECVEWTDAMWSEKNIWFLIGQSILMHCWQKLGILDYILMHCWQKLGILDVKSTQPHTGISLIPRYLSYLLSNWVLVLLKFIRGWFFYFQKTMEQMVDKRLKNCVRWLRGLKKSTLKKNKSFR
jgi:hypothetical protein